MQSPSSPGTVANCPASTGSSSEGTIRDAVDNPAVLTTPAVPDQPGQRVDGERPTIVATRALSVAGSEVSIAFDEPLDEGSVPAIGAFSVIGEGAAYSVTSVSIDGKSVWLALRGHQLGLGTHQFRSGLHMGTGE